MLWSGSAPRTVMRDNMWGFLMFAGVAWLAISWSVLRLEPSDVAGVAGPMILFGALCEGVRALAGTRTWWLNAGMGGLFALTGLVVLVTGDSSFATPAALVGWYLMVRGAMDVAVSTMNRGTDRTWGLVLALGVAQAGLGFVAAGPLTRSAEPVVLVLGGLGVLRAVADLVTALRLREVSGVRHDVLQLSPEREAGVAGYSAGLTDYDEQPKPDYEPHPRAELEEPQPARGAQHETARHETAQHETGQHETGQYQAAQHGTDQYQTAQHETPQPVYDGHEGYETRLRPAYQSQAQTGTHSQAYGQAQAQTQAQSPAQAAQYGYEPETARARHSADAPVGRRPRRFHDEVVQSTKDLDAVIARAGVTGTGGPAHRIPDNLPSAPDTAEAVAEVAEDRRR